MSDLPYPDLPPDVLQINAWFTDVHRPGVMWQLKGRWGVLSLVEARARAQALFQAVGYAEGEAAIVKGLIRLHADAQGTQGFAKADPRQQAAEVKALKMSAQLRHFLQQGRSPLMEGVDVIFGGKTRKALLNVFWYEDPIQWETSEAIEHAVILVEAAEAAESDAFFRWFLSDRIGVEPEEAYVLIREFQVFRQRRQLEDIFEGG